MVKRAISFLFIQFFLSSLFAQNIEWVKIFKGNDIERVVDMSIDTQDNIILLGSYYSSIDLDPGPDSLIATANALNDIFISKLTSDGDLIWAKTIGGPGEAWPGNIEVDSEGNIYASGNFNDTMDVDPGADTLNLYSGVGNYYIIKLDSSGNFINVYQSSGYTQPYSRNFTLKKNGNLLHGYGTYINELDTSMQLISTQFIALYSGISHISTDDENNTIVAGYLLYPADFDPGIDTFLLSPPYNQYGHYIAKYDSLGNFLWAKTIGTSSPGTHITGLTVDHSENVISSLYAIDTLYIKDNINDTSLTTINTGQSVYTLKFNPAGDLIWSQVLESSIGMIYSNAIMSDQSNRLYFSGTNDCNVDFDPGPDTFLVTTDFHPTYLQILDSNNTFLNFSSFTGNSLKAISALKVNSQGTLFAAGYFQLTCVFDSIAGISYASQGIDDGFLAKYHPLILGNIPEKIFTKTMSIYPNPGTDLINIKLANLNHGKAKINIINFLGTTIWSSTIENSLLNEGYLISLSDLSNGVYTIIISTENKLFSSRYIKLN